MSQQFEAENVGHVSYLDRMAAQLGGHATNLVLVAQRQRDPYLIDATGVEIAAELRDRTAHRHAFDRAAGERGRVVIERVDDQSGPRRLAQARDDLAGKLAGADDADVPQVVTAPAQPAQRHPQGDAQRGVHQQARCCRRGDPDTRITVAGLGEKGDHNADRDHDRPAISERAQVIGEARAALRPIQSGLGKDDDAEQRGAEQRDPVIGRQDRAAEVNQVDDPTDDDNNQRVDEAQQPIERRGVALEEIARSEHRGNQECGRERCCARASVT